MFSVWIALVFLGVDIRRFGDGNPGAGNVWRAGGGWKLGIPAPLLGHAFSPFLGCRGGEGVSATFGIWTGLIGPGGSLAFGLTSLVFWRLQRADGWTML